MDLRRAALIGWPLSLAIFGVVLWLHLPLAVPGVPGGIGEHQAAGNAATVDAIHDAWRAAGVYDQARTAMLADLAWIWTYGVASALAGLYFWRHGGKAVRTIGFVVIAAAIGFTVTDYIETVCQFIQLSEGQGNRRLSALAADVRPTKIAAWIACFVGVLGGALALRFASQPARSA